MLENSEFQHFDCKEFITFLMIFSDNERRIQVINGISTKKINIFPKIRIPISNNEHFTRVFNRLISKEYLLVYQVLVDGDCFDITVPEDKF